MLQPQIELNDTKDINGDVIVMLWIVFVPSDDKYVGTVLFCVIHPPLGCESHKGRLGFNPSCIFSVWNRIGEYFMEFNCRKE